MQGCSAQSETHPSKKKTIVNQAMSPDNRIKWQPQFALWRLLLREENTKKTQKQKMTNSFLLDQTLVCSSNDHSWVSYKSGDLSQ